MATLRFLYLLPLVCGCTMDVSLPPLSAAHPASPEAAEAPVAPASQTLALPAPGSAPADPMASGPAAVGGAHAGH